MMRFTIELKDDVIPEIVGYGYKASEGMSEQTARLMTLALATMCCEKVLNSVFALRYNDEEGHKDLDRAAMKLIRAMAEGKKDNQDNE